MIQNGKVVSLSMSFNMIVKPFLVSIYAILSFVCIARATRIPTFRCMQIGWEMCNIRQIDISPADRMVEDRSCFVDQGSNVTISFNFTPRFEAHNLKWGIWVETVIGDYKLEGVPPDARYLTNHPTIENKLNQFQSVLHIPKNTRAKLWVVRVTLTGDTDKDVCCFLCEIRVRKPQVTTLSSTIFDPTNPYDIVRKNVSYPSIWDFNRIVQNFQNDPEIFNKFILNNAVTTPSPGYFSIVKNAVKRLFGFNSETPTTCKVPFLGNASSLLEYFSGVIDQQNQFVEQNEQTESKTSLVQSESEYTRTSDVIREDTTTEEITTIPSTVIETTLNEEVYVSKADSEPIFSETAYDEKKADSDEDHENDENQTTTSAVETTHRHTKRRPTTRISQVSKKSITKRRPMKVSRTGIKKTVKPITKSTTELYA